MTDIFITATHTDAGKTIVSAVFMRAFGMGYWKPVQSGNLEASDSKTIENLLPEFKCKIYPESYRLKMAASPHISARHEDIQIHLENFKLPESKSPLVIEGAGGVMVPLNSNDLLVDLIRNLNKPVVIVSKCYLGSINHSLLTFRALKEKQIDVLGWVINGETNSESDEAIFHFSQRPILLRMVPEKVINREVIERYAGELRKNEHLFRT